MVSERSANKKEKMWLRCFVFREPCVEVTYFLKGGRKESGVLSVAAFGKLD